MPDQSPRLQLPYIQPSQAQKHVTHNHALERLDVVTQLVVEAFGAVTPPPAPVMGQIFALDATPLGDWAGQSGLLAQWNGENWLFITPSEGWRAFGVSEQELRTYQGGSWQGLLAGLDQLDQLGIGTSADPTNRLAVASDATLFSHNGAGHQIKINKDTAPDTATVLYQSGYIGHAEMGLAGDNNWSLKVSPDGTVWHQAMVVDSTAQSIAFAPAGTERSVMSDTDFEINVPVSGTAVQTDATDLNPTALMPVGAFGLGATDSIATRLTNGQIPLGSGFYSGSGSSANVATFPNSPSRYSPILSMNRRITTGQYQITRMYFSGQTPIINISSDTGATWGTYNTLYGTKNLVGTVSQSGGDPSGAGIERGANANGEYTRFADGTQMAWNGNAAITTAPASFVGTITKIDGDKLWIGRWF